MHLEQSPKAKKGTGRIGYQKNQDHWEWPEYWEESWRPMETCCHPDSIEIPPVGVKNEQGVK